MISFGECLKQARENAGLSQKELAEKINVPIQTISRYENSNTEPRISMAYNIAKALHMSIDELLQINWNIALIEPRTNDDCVFIANYYSNLLNSNFSLSYQNNKFYLTALKNFDNKFFVPIKVNDVFEIALADFLVIMEQIKFVFNRTSKTAYNESVLNCFISFAQMYNWRKEHENE